MLEQTLAEVRAEPLESALRVVVGKMVASHADPLHQVLARGLDELGAATSLQATIDARAGAAVEAFLRERSAQIRPRSLALAALLLVRAVDLLTHAALEHHQESLEDGTLVDELSALAIGYLRPVPHGGAEAAGPRRAR